jgi:Fe-S cluster assembly protein SufD
MTQQLQTQQQQTAPFLEAYQALQGAHSAAPDWLRQVREAAMARFQELGFPTARRGNEAWKYTDIRPVVSAGLAPVVPDAPMAVTQADLASFSFGEPHWNLLVFVDGRFAPSLSAVQALPRGVHLGGLAGAVATDADLVQAHLAHYAGYQDHAFAALNTAMARDGAFIYVPDEADVKVPVRVLYLSSAQGDQAVAYPRTLVVVGRDARVTLIEIYGALTGGRYLANAVTEVMVGQGASVRHYRLQRHSESAFHVGATNVVQTEGSSYHTFALDLGGGLVRNDLNVLLDGEYASCAIGGAYLVTRRQHLDNHAIIDHATPHTTSQELYKGVLNGRSRAVFHGSIIVRPNAQKVDSRQEARNLLLSPEAEADSQPAFWIYADDVKCSHGAASGKIDENSLFYLRARGIGEQEARALLTHAFVAEVTDTIGNEAFRSHVEDLVDDRLREF